MSEPPGIPDFKSDDALAGVMSGPAARLHAKNRIWPDESCYAWLRAR